MRVAICDDEHFSLKTIKELIRKYYFDHDKLFISEFNNGEEFLAEFSEYKNLSSQEKYGIIKEL